MSRRFKPSTAGFFGKKRLNSLLEEPTSGRYLERLFLNSGKHHFKMQTNTLLLLHSSLPSLSRVNSRFVHVMYRPRVLHSRELAFAESICASSE